MARLVVILHGRKELNVVRYNFGHISLRTVLRIIGTDLNNAFHRDFAALGGHSAQGALEKLLPNSMRPVAVKKWGVDPATRAAQITREQKMALVHLCKHWQVPISELGDLQHAVITAGGVDTKEVDPKTMQSKLCPGLYFAGEVLDVDARTGGYNLQIAWATAQAAVRAIGNDT